MLMPLIIGTLILAVNVIVQAAAVWVVVGRLAQRVNPKAGSNDRLGPTLILPEAVVLMFAGHLIQMGIWATSFVALGEFEGFPEAFYHSAVNFTSLGYGDVVMSERWRLLGALEAGSGVLMFGVSTALSFAIIARMLEHRLPRAREDGTTRSRPGARTENRP